MAHDEFPPLTNAVRNVLAVASHRMDVSKPCWDRRFSSASIREAVKQAAPFNLNKIVDMSIQQVIPSHQPEKRKGLLVVAVQDLMDIANNLHSPSQPPTREQMEAALKDLLQDCGGDEWRYARLEILKAGIAHHFKEQP